MILLPLVDLLALHFKHKRSVHFITHVALETETVLIDCSSLWSFVSHHHEIFSTSLSSSLYDIDAVLEVTLLRRTQRSSSPSFPLPSDSGEHRLPLAVELKATATRPLGLRVQHRTRTK